MFKGPAIAGAKTMVKVYSLYCLILILFFLFMGQVFLEPQQKNMVSPLHTVIQSCVNSLC